MFKGYISVFNTPTENAIDVSNLILLEIKPFGTDWIIHLRANLTGPY